MTSSSRFGLIVLILLLCAGLVSAGQYDLRGYVLGDCHGGANVTIRVYNEGFLNDGGNLVDTVSQTTSADGAYGVNSGLVGDSTDYDINYSVTNPSCSPGAFGSVARLSETSSGQFQPAIIVLQNITATAPFYLVSPGNGSTASDNETAFDWESDYASATYTLQVANTSAFAVLEREFSGLGSTAYTLTTPQALKDGVYYWRVQAIDGGNIDNTSAYSFEVAAGAASISSPSPANGSWTADSTPMVTFSTNIDATCAWATSPGVAYESKTSFTTTGGSSHGATLSLGSEGNNTFYIMCNTTNGVVNSQDYQYTLALDTTAPSAGTATVSIDGGATYSLDTTLDFVWSGFSDTGSGLSSYYYSLSDGSGTSSGTSDASSPGTLSGAGQGTVRVYVWAVDQMGNIGLAANDAITVDTLPPSFSSWSSSPADLTKYSTGDFDLSVTMSEISGLNATPQFRYHLGNDSWSSWADLSLVASGGSTYNYDFTIPEQSSPNTWFERSGENLTYELFAEDIHGRNNTVTRNEFINNQSTAPVLTAISNKQVYEEEKLVFNVSASDQDLNTLTYTCNLSDVSITKLNNTLAEVSWTPTNDDVGTNPVHCNVTDGTFIVSDSFTVTVLNVNDAPVLEAIGSLYAQEYEFFNFTLNGSDPDDDLIIYSGNASFFSVNSITGKIAFTPFSQNRGVHRVNFSVDDGLGGHDYELVSFTIGWCGDGVCNADFETCSVCELDCGTCEEEESKAIVVDPRNCLDTAMSIEAVTLVSRATCATEGSIIDGMEVCGVEDDSSLRVFYQVGDEWEEVTQLVTDESGLASFTPQEEGEYIIRFASDASIETPFEINACTVAEVKQQTSTSKPSKPSTDETTLPPVIEEPAVVEDVESGWQWYAVFLYFVVIPLLLVLLVASSLGFVYRYERRKSPESSFVVLLDKWIAAYREKRKVLSSWMEKTPPFNYFLDLLRFSRKFLAEQAVLVRKGVTRYWSSFILILGLQRSVSLPFYNLNVPGKRLHLMLIALLKLVFPKRGVDELLGLTYQFGVKSIYDVAALLVSFHVSITLVDPRAGPAADILRRKGSVVLHRPMTRVDVESALMVGSPVVAVVNELGENNSLVQRLIAVYSFDRSSFYYHDYQGGKKAVRVSKNQFMKAWHAAGSKAIVVQRL